MANYSPNIPDFPTVNPFLPCYGKFDLTTYIQGASDYEIMANLVQLYNTMAKGYNDVQKLSTDTVTAFNQLQDFVNSFFNSPDVKTAIANKLQEFMNNGQFAAYIKTYMPYITPEMFGAVGDGITDDSFAIQQALDFGGICWLSEKTYLIQKPITVNITKSALRGCSSRSVIKAGDNFITDNYKSCIIFYSHNGDYYTRQVRENEHGCFRIEANNHNGFQIGGPRNTPLEGSCECQTFHNIMCVKADTAVIIGPHSYRNEYREIDTYECNYGLTTPDPYDINEVNTFYNCGFWAGSVDISVPTSFFGCTFHLTLQKDSNDGYKFAHRFRNGNYNLIACHFEYLTPAEEANKNKTIDSGLVAIDASVYIEGAEMVFTQRNNTLTISNYLFYCIDTSIGFPTGFTLNHCNTRYLFNRIILTNGALANWGLVSYNGEYQNAWQLEDSANYRYNKTTSINMNDNYTPMTKLGTSESLDYNYDTDNHTLTVIGNGAVSQLVTIGKTVSTYGARSVHVRVKASAPTSATSITINLGTNCGLIFLDANGNSLNNNAILINNNWQYFASQNVDFSKWLAIPAGCTEIIYGIGIVGTTTLNETITIDECYIELV